MKLRYFPARRLRSQMLPVAPRCAVVKLFKVDISESVSHLEFQGMCISCGYGLRKYSESTAAVHS